MIKNGYHEIYLDYEKDEVCKKILEWITASKPFGKTDKRNNKIF